MIRYENDCCDCASPGYPCLGSACSLRHSPHIYCDMCGQEMGEGDLGSEFHVCDSCAEQVEQEGE